LSNHQVKALERGYSLDNQSSNTQAKPTFSPYQEGVKKALKDMGEQHTVEALQQGIPADHIEQQAGLSQQDILNQILQLSQAKVPSKMEQGGALNQFAPQGIIGGLLSMAQGKAFNAPRMEPLGMSNAIQLQGALQSGQKNALDIQKFPLEYKKLEQETNPDFQLAQLRKQEEMKADVRNQEEQKKAIAKEQLETEKTFNQVINLNDNLISTLKGAFVQQGGEGPISGILGNVKAAIGMPNTGNIKALKAVKRDTAISYARQLAGGARGVATFFRSVLDSLPDNKFTSEQAGTTMAELSLTAYAMKKGINDLKLSQDQLNGMTPDQIEVLAAKEKSGMSQEEQNKIYSTIQNRFSTIAPRRSINLEGKVSNQNQSMPHKGLAPKGAKGYDTVKKAWVY
jgi:hypothetical protein